MGKESNGKGGEELLESHSRSNKAEEDVDVLKMYRQPNISFIPCSSSGLIINNVSRCRTQSVIAGRHPMVVQLASGRPAFITDRVNEKQRNGYCIESKAGS